MELVSLVGFPPGVELYAEYEVHLPPGWRAETPRGDDHGRTWTENDEGGLCCAGTSQLARSVLRPCRAAHGSKRSAEDRYRRICETVELVPTAPPAAPRSATTESSQRIKSSTRERKKAISWFRVTEDAKAPTAA